MNKVPCLLLVDDDKITTYINASLIKKLNICDHVKTSTNGKEAIDALLSKSCEDPCPSIIFLDINMPVMNGFEFMEAFNRLVIHNKNTIKIIVLTTSSREEDLSHMKNLGVKYFLQKPLKEESVKKILAEINS